MQKNCTCSIVRNPGPGMYRQIMDIRREHHYLNNRDKSYWNGGIYGILSEKEIKNTHEKDNSSMFLLITGKDEELIAYARYSTKYNYCGKEDFAKLHIFIARKKYKGVKLYFTENGRIFNTKAGDFILEKVIRLCRNSGAAVLLSEICIFPYPNLPSLIIHKKYGFLSIGEKLKEPDHDSGNIFIILGKNIEKEDLPV